MDLDVDNGLGTVACGGDSRILEPIAGRLLERFRGPGGPWGHNGTHGWPLSRLAQVQLRVGMDSKTINQLQVNIFVVMIADRGIPVKIA
jgi:hypothetical protein